MTRGFPEQGQLVHLRGRPFVVTEVVRSAPMNGGLRTNGDPQHLVTATSIEEDALGEELQVIWELEPGAETKDKMALPEPTLPHAGIERPAGDAEVAAGEKFIERQRRSYENEGETDAAWLARTDYCQTLLSLNEFLYIR